MDKYIRIPVKPFIPVTKTDKALYETVTKFMSSHDTIFADELTIILKGHLIVDILMGQIIKNKLKNPKNIQDFRFKAKIEILYSSNFIPEYLYKNIITLNKIRNRYAHNLDYDLMKGKYQIIGINGKVIKTKLKGKTNTSKNRAHIICSCILIQLSEYMEDKLNIEVKLK